MSDTRLCDACGQATLVPFADLGEMPIGCGVHFASREEAVAAASGRMTLASCPHCAYVRNIAFEPERLTYDTEMDTNLHHSGAFRAFSHDLALGLTERYELAGKRVLDIGCGQGEFLRELCELGGSTGVGFDAMYAGPTGRDADVTFFSRLAPRGPELTRRVAEALDGPFDVITSRHWFEHLDDPYEFLVDLREQAAGRPVVMYVEVPDACYDLATAGWEVIYPHVSYFDESSLARVFERAGWKVERSGTLFSGMFRFIEASVNRPEGPHNTVDSDTVDRQLRAIGGFAARHFGERERWRRRIAELDEDGAHPVMWGAGSRGVQFLNFADPIGVLGAVVDVNPRKWSRYLPGTGHRVDPPATLTELKTRAVIITNPAYRAEIAADLIDLGVSAEILVA